MDVKELWRYFVRRFDGSYYLWRFVGDSKEEAFRDAETWQCDNPKHWEMLCAVSSPNGFRFANLPDAIGRAAREAAAAMPSAKLNRAYPVGA